MKVAHLPIWYLKGATAYELQVWRFGVKYVHLKGKYYWKSMFNIFKRLSFQYYKP